MPAAKKPKFSVIIPVAPDDDVPPQLITQLNDLVGAEAELIITATTSRKTAIDINDIAFLGAKKIVTTSTGRALQLNGGAKIAQGDYLWFVHADSNLNEIKPEALAAISTFQTQGYLYYFDLGFHDQFSWQLKINEFGVWLRSHLLKMPFGDQGLIASRQDFIALDGFSESATYGEDHLYVWQSRKNDISLHPLPGKIKTSSRKYQRQGWGKTTLGHLFHTFAQAIPAALGLHPAVRRKGH